MFVYDRYMQWVRKIDTAQMLPLSRCCLIRVVFNILKKSLFA